MKSSRRKFLRNGLIAGLGSFVLPPFAKKVFGSPKIKNGLNYVPKPAEWSNDDLTVAWIGHSTMLINFYGKWIITDPVLYDSVGLYFFGTSLGPSRLTPPALNLDEIPKPDLILQHANATISFVAELVTLTVSALPPSHHAPSLKNLCLSIKLLPTK